MTAKEVIEEIKSLVQFRKNKEEEGSTEHREQSEAGKEKFAEEATGSQEEAKQEEGGKEPLKIDEKVTELESRIGKAEEEIEQLKTELVAIKSEKAQKEQEVETLSSAFRRMIELVEKLANLPTADPIQSNKDGFRKEEIKNKASLKKEWAEAFASVRK